MNDPAYEHYRNGKLKSGAEFQDFIMERMHAIGVILQPYTSRVGQLKGENLLGMEIKHDEKMRETGNVCIEIAEKARPRDGDYVPSGIFRSDNTWLYGIGDRMLFYIFAKSTLKNAYAKREQFRFREYDKPTSLGFLIPSSIAKQICARLIQFDFEGQIRDVFVGGDKSEIDLQDIPRPDQFQLRMKL